MNQEKIVLFNETLTIDVELSQKEIIEYLKKYCTMDTLGDTIYVKKLGNDKTTYAIEFRFEKISMIKKIKDSEGNNDDSILFDCSDTIEDEPFRGVEFESVLKYDESEIAEESKEMICDYCGCETNEEGGYCSERCRKQYEKHCGRGTKI